MATAAVKTDREALLAAVYAGRKVDPEVRRRVSERVAKLRTTAKRTFADELSVELIRAVRAE